MKDSRYLDRLLERLGWGALFVWWGLSFLPGFFPNGLDAAGTGVILLGVNAARWLKGVPARGFSVMLGVLALVWGGLDMSRSVFHLPYRLPVFAILLVVGGLELLISATLRQRERRWE